MPDLQNELVRRAMARDAAQTIVDPNAPVATAQIGALDPRTTPVRPSREDPFSTPDWIQSILETVQDPSNWGFGGGGGAAMHAVAAGGPANIPKLKASGLALLEKVKAEGLLPKGMGGEGSVLNEQALKALEYAQKRYPRLFGHLTSISDIDLGTKMRNAGKEVLGGSTGVGNLDAARAGRDIAHAPKLSSLELNPTGATPHTIGHELLHTADRLTMGKEFDKAYEASQKLPPVFTEDGRYITPYRGSSQEVRARNAGDSMWLKMVEAGILPRP